VPDPPPAPLKHDGEAVRKSAGALGRAGFVCATALEAIVLQIGDEAGIIWCISFSPALFPARIVPFALNRPCWFLHEGQALLQCFNDVRCCRFAVGSCVNGMELIPVHRRGNQCLQSLAVGVAEFGGIKFRSHANRAIVVDPRSP